MNRREFRKALTKAKTTLIYGHESSEKDFSPLEALAGKFFMSMSQRYDPLWARMGGFTTDARSRIANYPLRKTGGSRG
ncbi:hypothetical protein ACI77O_12690 [Pseudomonas tritici]|uniref:hypothetical protein n=1 Tax=Pseudomonas tritici TaxID=2745518 RepID=UPI00387AAE11